MRIVREVAHPRFKITIFSWNSKYIIKIEDAHLEQTYKIDENQVEGLDTLENMLSTEFLLKVLKRFSDMDNDFREAFKYRFAK